MMILPIITKRKINNENSGVTWKIGRSPIET